jgi:hypothetical protein
VLLQGQKIPRKARKMKRLFVLLILLGFLFIPAMAMVIQEPKEGKITESPTIILPKETIIPEETILPIIPNRELFIKKLVQYNERTTVLKRITMIFDKIRGLTPVDENVETIDIDVVLDDQIIAVIPTDSPLNGIETHEYCLEYQYGTTNWYNCEQELL